MSQRLQELRRKRAELGLEITLPIKTRSTQLADPIECCGAPADFKSFTHTFYCGLVCVKVPEVLGYECGKCKNIYLLDDVGREIDQWVRQYHESFTLQVLRIQRLWKYWDLTQSPNCLSFAQSNIRAEFKATIKLSILRPI